MGKYLVNSKCGENGWLLLSLGKYVISNKDGKNFIIEFVFNFLFIIFFVCGNCVICLIVDYFWYMVDGVYCLF